MTADQWKIQIQIPTGTLERRLPSCDQWVCWIYSYTPHAYATHENIASQHSFSEPTAAFPPRVGVMRRFFHEGRGASGPWACGIQRGNTAPFAGIGGVITQGLVRTNVRAKGLRKKTNAAAAATRKEYAS